MKKSFYDKIDILKEKFDSNKPVDIHEASFILYAEHYVCSESYLAFQSYIKKKTKFYKEKLEFCIWYGIYNAWSSKNT